MFPVFIAMGIAGTVASSQPFEYPKDRKGDVIDNYFGVKVPDPYRWLENVDSPETLQWINEENRLTQSYLRELPERDPFRDRLAKLLNFERYTVPIWEGGRYIYRKNDGLQNQSVVYTAHSFKFAAALQAAQGCTNPVLIRIDSKAGHGSGKPITKIIEEQADVLSFMWNAVAGTESLPLRAAPLSPQ